MMRGIGEKDIVQGGWEMRKEAHTWKVMNKSTEIENRSELRISE